MQFINFMGKMAVHCSFLKPDQHLSEGLDRSNYIQKTFLLYLSTAYSSLCNPDSYVSKGEGVWAIKFTPSLDIQQQLSVYLKQAPIQRNAPNILVVAKSVLKQKEARALYSEEFNIIFLSIPDEIADSPEEIANFINNAKKSKEVNYISLSLSHEFTHFLDYCRWPVEYKLQHKEKSAYIASLDKDTDLANIEYFNRPSEVQALTQEIIRLFKEKPYFSKKAVLKAIPMLIDDLSASKYLNDHNKNKIAKEVYKYFDANGIEHLIKEGSRLLKQQEELVRILKEINGPRDLDNMVRDIFDSFLKQMPETYEKELFTYLFEKGEPGYVQSMREMARDANNTGEVFQKTVESHVDDKFGEDDMPSIAMQDRYSNVDWNKMKKYWTMLQQKLTGAMDAGIQKATNVVSQGV